MKTYRSSQMIKEDLGPATFCCQLKGDQKFLDVDAAFAAMVGFSKSMLMKKTLADIAQTPSAYKEFIHRIKKEGKVKNFELCLGHRTKKDLVSVMISAGRVQDGKGADFVQGLVQDVTCIQSRFAKIAGEVSLLESFLNQMPDAIYFKDVKCRITKVNRFYAKGFKMDPKEVIGKTDYDFFPKDQAEQMIKDDQQVMKTGVPIIGKIERTLLPNKTWNQVLTTKVPILDSTGKAVGMMGITRDMTEHANLEKERFNMLVNALAVLNRVLEMRDPYTFSHACNVSHIAEVIGQRLGFNENRLIGLKLAADLHDLGKISIPLDILTKPGDLTLLEYNLVKEHVQNCYDLIKEMPFPFALSEIVYQHHERLDGSGYPNKVHGDKIMLEAKILAVSDVLESMTNHRPYRAALGIKKALKELKSGAGKKYDAKIVGIVEELVRKNKGKPFWPIS
ncbi:MAG: HD domain-containing phosphohydrolase [Candidatus Omnitrophota bacterium]